MNQSITLYLKSDILQWFYFWLIFFFFWLIKGTFYYWIPFTSCFMSPSYNLHVLMFYVTPCNLLPSFVSASCHWPGTYCVHLFCIILINLNIYTHDDSLSHCEILFNVLTICVLHVALQVSAACNTQLSSSNK